MEYSDTDPKEFVFGPGNKWCGGRWSSSEIARAGLSLPKKVIIMDQTIREGEDTPDVFFSSEDKLEIVRNLQEIGVPEMELGYVGAIDEQYGFAQSLKKTSVKMKLGSHNRTYTKGDEWKEETDRAIEAGCTIINFVSWISKRMLKTTPWLRKEEVPERIAKCIEYAKAQGVSTSLVLADLAGTRLDLIVKCCEAAADAGADRLYVGDGAGGSSAESVSFLVRLLRDIGGPKIKVALHCHNDYGLSMANALSGIKAGAEVIDVTANGLGHNSGITPLETIVVALNAVYGVETDVKLEKIYGFCKLVERLSGVNIYANAPIVGRNFYRHQLDSHITGIIRAGWYTWEGIRPDVLGRTRSLEWARGKLRRGRSGSIDAKVDQMGLKATDEQVKQITETIRDAVQKKDFLTEKEVEGIIKQAIGK